jgi:hypothetical protein
MKNLFYRISIFLVCVLLYVTLLQQNGRVFENIFSTVPAVTNSSTDSLSKNSTREDEHSRYIFRKYSEPEGRGDDF